MLETDEYKIVPLKNEIIKIPLSNEKPVIKNWFDKNRAQMEFESLNYIYNIIGNIQIEDWKYKSLQPYKLEDNSVFMEKARGYEMSTLIIKNPTLAYYAGVWLATYHNKINDMNAESTFGDFSINNILIDENSKIITAI